MLPCGSLRSLDLPPATGRCVCTPAERQSGKLCSLMWCGGAFDWPLPVRLEAHRQLSSNLLGNAMKPAFLTYACALRPLMQHTVQAVVVLRTLLQDRIAMLNGRSVEHVLRQDVGAFRRLIALSAVQVFI